MISSATRIFEFSAGHTLPGHPGKCRWLHGHNYRMEVTVEGQINDQGMVIDFGDLKAIVNQILMSVDHHFLMWGEDPRIDAMLAMDPESIVVVNWPPTAEHLAMWFRDLIEDQLRKVLTDPEVHTLLWETDHCYAAV